MKYRVVTTIHAAGWAAYGEAMVDSVIARWPAEALPVILYAEGFDPEPRPGLEVRPCRSGSTISRPGSARHAANTGHRPGGYDYRFDAVKFAHKVAALTDAALGLTDETLIWLDADTFTHADVDAAWLDGLFPGSGYLAWLDRNHTHPECGFVMFRCGHPYHRRFMERFRDLYINGEVFSLRETHDSYVLQHLVLAKVANAKIEAPVSLSGWARRTAHPFCNGPWASGSTTRRARASRCPARRTATSSSLAARPTGMREVDNGYLKFKDVQAPLQRRVQGNHDLRLDGVSDILHRAHGASVFDIGCNRGLAGYEFAGNGAAGSWAATSTRTGSSPPATSSATSRAVKHRFEVVDLTGGAEAMRKAFGKDATCATTSS
jgi:hypothetical protein